MKYKGCVVEVRTKTLVLMTASCDFVEIPRKGTGLVAPGMEVDYETRSHGFAVYKKWLAVAAMAMVLVMGSLLMLPPTSAMPVYMASIDINPSFNMFIDEEGQVVEIQPMNTEAKSLKTRNLEGKNIEEVVSSLMEQLVDQGYFTDQGEHYMVFSLTAIDSSVTVEKVSVMKHRLENTIQEEKQLREIDFEILSYAAMEAEVEEAESGEVTLNHLLVRNQYQAMMGERPSETDEQVENSMETMVRTILKEKEHPVFREHPGADPGGDKVKNDDDVGRHPVFEEHPGNPGKGNDQENRSDNQMDSQQETQGKNGGQGRK